MRPDVMALVLAGGSSRRFGRDKASVVVKGASSLQRVVRAALEVARPVYVAGGDGPVPDGVDGRLSDPEPGGGPLQALAGAFHRFPGVDILVLPCDIPLVSTVALVALAEPLAPPFVARVPRVEGVPQPLTALYGAQAAGSFGPAVLAGRRSVRRLLKDLPVAWMEADRWEGAPGDLASLRDFDTPEDLIRLVPGIRKDHLA